MLSKTLGRLLATAGVKFEAINVAMGNTRVAPYSWCVDAHAGLDADIISWDMTMMLASNQCGRAATGVELFIRSASVLPKRPAVLLTDASPDQVHLLWSEPASVFPAPPAVSLLRQNSILFSVSAISCQLSASFSRNCATRRTVNRGACPMY